MVVSTDSTTLTFYYDDQRSNRTGAGVHGIDDLDQGGYPKWINVDYYEGNGQPVSNPWIENPYTTVVFDDSFKDAKPTSCAWWFNYCTKLTEIKGIEKLNTENVTNMGWMFEDCSSLTTLDVSNFNTANVTDMRDMFNGCSSLTTLDVSKFNTENVTDMVSMFEGCSSLTTLDVSNFNTGNVTSMFNMFRDCYNLISIDVSRFNTENVIDMLGMFCGCRSLTNIDVRGFVTNKATSIAVMFCDCRNLSSIDVSGFVTDNVKDMQAMFQSCHNLESINVSNFNTVKVTNMMNMFMDCSKLTVLDIRNFETKHVEDMRDMFSSQNLTTILVSDKWSIESVKTSPDDFPQDYYAGPFITSLNLIGNAGTTYSDEHTDVDYAHIDTESSPGYFTTESYKVFYDLDGDGKIDDLSTVDWENDATPPTSFALDGTQELPIPNPISKKGLKFKGWKGTPITGLTEDNLQKDISIPAGTVGNRIYTAMWGEMYTVKFIIDGEEQKDLEVIVEPNSKITAPTISSKPKFTFHGWYTDEACTNEWNFNTDEVSEDITLYAVWTPKDITISIPEKIIYPAIPQENDAVCNGSEKYAVLRFPLPEDVSVTKYELSIPNIISADGTPETTDTGCEINIPISADKTPGRYSGIVKLYIDQNPVAKEYSLTIEVAVAHNVLLHLYKDVIFVNNHDGLYGENGTYQWYRNNQEIPKANNQYIHDPNISGIYKAKMYTTDGLEVYSCPIDEGEGLSKDLKLQVKTYPNPVVAGNEFTLEIEEYDPSAAYTIHISNSNGVVVKEIVNATEYTLVTLPRGIYSCVLVSGSRKRGFKIIVK